jgi:enediyne biosynthesis thioesterase
VGTIQEDVPARQDLQDTKITPFETKVHPSQKSQSMKSYTYKSVVTIGDTNCLGNVYFLNHLKLSGMVRELWLGSAVQNVGEHLAGGLLLVTHSVSCDFMKDFFVFDPIRCEMIVRNVKRASAELVFRFYHDQTNELHAVARHTIVFADRAHKICPMPDDFRRAARQIEEHPAPAAPAAPRAVEDPSGAVVATPRSDNLTDWAKSEGGEPWFRLGDLPAAPSMQNVVRSRQDLALTT